MHRALSSSVIVLIVVSASSVSGPSRALAAQAFDSTGMPSLELLALEAGRASRHHPIRAVAHAMLCEPTHPLVDSASVAACAALDSTRAAAFTATFARGLDVPIATTADSAFELPVCPADIDRVEGPRTLLARVTAPVVGVREQKWEGRLSVELRCRSPANATGQRVRTLGKEYLYQWSGHAWQLYQFSWWRAER